jgi:hypothetical protein
MTTGKTAGTWYWCVRHERAEEEADACPAEDRLGPYDSKEEAQHWRERVDARNDRWDEQDREWSGEEEE